MATNLILNKERLINAPHNIVWQVITLPEHIQKWLGVEVVSDWQEGASIKFQFEWEGKKFEDKGKILTLEKGKAFSYLYWSGFSGLPDIAENYSRISFKLEMKEGKTELKLTHSDFASEMMYQHSDKNWEETLDSIKNLAEQL